MKTTSFFPSIFVFLLLFFPFFAEGQSGRKCRLPLDTLGQVERITACAGDSISFCLPAYPELTNGPYTFNWLDENGMAVPADSCFSLSSLDGTNIGEYRCEIIKNDRECYITQTFKIDTFQVDSNGTKIFPNQIVIQFRPDATEDTVQAFIDKYQMTPLDTCMCNDLFLFEFPDSMMIDGGGFLVDPESKKNKVDMDGDIPPNGSDWNYWVDTNAIKRRLPKSRPGGPQLLALNGPSPLNTSGAVLAISDTGMDPDLFSNVLWQNQSELNGLPGVDDDGNCLIDDINGYDLADDDAAPDDILGHGSFVGVIAAEAAGLDLTGPVDNPDIALAPIKIFDDLNKKTSLFYVLCSILYADRQGMDVFNGSFGWLGSKSGLMEKILEVNWPDAQDNFACPTLYVFSAGNDMLLLDTNDHWPSNLTGSIDSFVLSVGAYALEGEKPAPAVFSNYSGLLVDVLALGSHQENRVVNGNTFSFAGEGTSFAAPVVSGLAARMRLANKAHPTDIKNVLLANASQDPVFATYSKNNNFIPFDVNTLRDQLISNNIGILQPGIQPCWLYTDVEEVTTVPFETLVVSPNPFLGELRIEFSLSKPDFLEFTLFDVTGQPIQRSFEHYGAGTHVLKWTPPSLPAGLYLYQLRTSGGRSVGKIVKK